MESAFQFLIENLWGALTSILIGVAIYIIKKKLDKMEVDNIERTRFINAIAFGSVVSLRKQIHDIYKRTISDGFILPDDYDLVCDMFEAYTQLGGNHGVSKMMDEIKIYPSSPLVDKKEE
jgi:hypothetical protein